MLGNSRSWLLLETCGGFLRLAAAALLTFLGFVALAAPKDNASDIALGLILGLPALGGGIYLPRKHIRRFSIQPTTCFLIIGSLSLWFATLAGPGTGWLAIARLTPAAFLTLLLLQRRRITTSPLRSIADVAFASITSSIRKIDSATTSFADPITNLIRKSGLGRWHLYVAAYMVPLLAGELLFAAFVGVDPYGFSYRGMQKWWVFELVGQIMVLPSMSIFTLGLMQIHVLERLTKELPERLSAATDDASVFTNLGREVSRWQNKLFRMLLVFLASATCFGALAAVLFTLYQPPHSNDFANAPILRGVPLVVTVTLLVSLAAVFLYATIVMSARALFTVSWLNRILLSDKFVVKEDHPDGVGGFAAIGDYALGMMTIALTFSLWVSFVVYRDAGPGWRGVVTQAAKMTPYYTFDVVLLALGTGLPLYLGGRLYRAACQRRLDVLASEIRKPNLSDDARERNGVQAFMVRRLPRWPIKNAGFGLMVGALALCVNAALQMGSGISLLGFGAAGYGLTVFSTFISVVYIVIRVIR